jgi:limonene-1,2-epoxide hydrolase
MPSVAAVISFIDAINRGDVDRLAALTDANHRLQVLDESPLDGKDPNIAAWRGYASSFPGYVIYPHNITQVGAGEVAVLGHRTGSHLGLPDDEESRLLVIWHAAVRDGRLTLWQILEDTPARRTEFALAMT